ncbi:hypothetical protein Tco_0802699 [Tanacetum coccineum]|uniref:Uncharacterized protein n=1 Tax=Tanacetum coccineum TaxID=301880 RepID=A0ABQ5A2A2_9ASTR
MQDGDVPSKLTDEESILTYSFCIMRYYKSYNKKALRVCDIVACTIAGAVVLLLLPVMAKKAYVTENALMPRIIEDMIQVGLL